MDKEYILCSAIWYNDKKFYHKQPNNIKTGYIVCGYRHDRCFNMLYRLEKKVDAKLLIQGFLTSLERFVTREEGGKIAFKSGQIDKDNGCLLSEDLYNE
jgi:hypothetical protein